MKKLVLKVDYLRNNKSRLKARRELSSLGGLDSIAVNKNKKILTVVGDVDPADVVRKLRKLMHPNIKSHL